MDTGLWLLLASCVTAIASIIVAIVTRKDKIREGVNGTHSHHALGAELAEQRAQRRQVELLNAIELVSDRLSAIERLAHRIDDRSTRIGLALDPDGRGAVVDGSRGDTGALKEEP